MPTLPGPTSQTPLLQAKFVVISVAAAADGGDDDGLADGDEVGFGFAPAGAAVATAAGTAAPRIAAASDPVISSALSGERMANLPWPRERPVSVLAGCGESARQGASGDTYPLRNT